MTDVLKSVFFSGVPLSVGERQLRKLFSQSGHVVAFRVMPPLPGKEFQSGFVDYLDGRSADDAMAQLDGFVFGDAKMKVTNATSRKRNRSEVEGGVASGGTDAGPLMEFKRDFQNLLLPGDRLIEDALRQLSVAEAYEAIEQLRILVLERPEETRELLENNPQLAVAAVMILQHAGKLPSDHLPPEAIVNPRAATTLEDSSNAVTSSSTAAGGSASSQHASPSPETIAQVMSIIESMKPEDVEKIINMTPAQLAAIPDEGTRVQLAFLQKQLKLMDAM